MLIASMKGNVTLACWEAAAVHRPEAARPEAARGKAAAAVQVVIKEKLT